MLTLDKVYHAAFKLKEVIRPTDLIHAPQINPDADVYLKTENLQVTGSFKVRGAYYKISTLTDEEKKHGVIACSAGNHAQGVALAAQRSGIKSIICLPDGAPISKVEATRSYGAEICLVEAFGIISFHLLSKSINVVIFGSQGSTSYGYCGLGASVYAYSSANPPKLWPNS